MNNKKDSKNNVLGRCFGYVRVSSQNQISGGGIPRQEDEIKNYCQVHNLVLDRIFYDRGISGVKDDRRGLTEMMLNLKDGDICICEGLSRLSRNLILQETIIQDLNKKGCSLISCQEGELSDEEDNSRVLIRQIFGCINEYDKKMIVERLRLSRERIRKDKGKCEGRKGYQDTDEGKIIIKKIKSLRRVQKGGWKYKPKFICKKLNEDGYTLDGNVFTKKNVLQIIYRHC